MLLATTTTPVIPRLAATICVPLLLLVLSSLAKKVSRGSGWKLEDWYQGTESTLGAITSALIYLSAVSSVADIPLLVAFLFAGFVLLLLVMALHQTFGPEKSGAGRVFFLAILSNVIGSGLIGILVWLKGAP